VAHNREWAVGSNQYMKRPQRGSRGNTEPSVTLQLPASEHREQDTGIAWDRTRVDWEALTESTTERVRARYRSSLPEYIWDAAALEGNPYTLPEVQTLLEGITVTGHRLEDQNQILALNEAYNTVDSLVAAGAFRMDKSTSDSLHVQVAVHEAIESGNFRGEGRVGGGGLVNLGALGTYHASAPGESGSTLIEEHRALLSHLDDIDDPREQALVYFCAATRRQFYFDGNKRTARLMMTGHLMRHGFDAISISARRRLEFNDKLGRMFDTGHATEMMAFLIDCRPAA